VTKITLNLKSLLGILLFAVSSYAQQVATPKTWEVAILFLGSQEKEEVQGDVDRNILELAKTKPNRFYHLAIARDFAQRSVSYLSTPQTAAAESLWDPLFYSTPLSGVIIPGKLETVETQGNTILDDPERLKSFFGSIYRTPGAKRLLVIYGHGEAYDGLRLKKLLPLQKILTESIPARPGHAPTDILWMDSCFMGNLEAAYQLRNLTHYYLASQEAEFTAGMPFDSLSFLENGPSDVVTVAKDLARRFIESYSYIENGRQSSSVSNSSATMSLLNVQALPQFIKGFASLKKIMARDDLARALHQSQSSTMEKPELLDLGQFLLATKSPLAATLLRSLNVSNKRILRSNPRVLIKPEAATRILFGFENWTRGQQSDGDIIQNLPRVLLPAGFAPGPKHSIWPYRSVQKRLYVSPFLPGISTFNFKMHDQYFSYTRKADIYFSESVRQDSLILFQGYTQGVGQSAEKYTGLSIANPQFGAPNVDYLENDFYLETRWSE